MDHHLGTAASDVDHHQLPGQPARPADPDEGQVCLFLVCQDLQRDAGCGLYFAPCIVCVGRTPERLRPDEGDRRGSQPSAGIGVGDQRRHEPAAHLRPEAALLRGIAQPQEHRLVEQRLQPVA